MAEDLVLECCLEGVESAAQASLGGAHRVELCANLAQVCSAVAQHGHDKSQPARERSSRCHGRKLKLRRGLPSGKAKTPSQRSSRKHNAPEYQASYTAFQGGVTPSIGDVELAVSALARLSTRVHVLIRPRPGDFVYTDLEKQVMVRDVEAAVSAGAHGVVIGALLSNGGIDEETTARLVAASGPSSSVTFHRAFDCSTTEPAAALETLIRLGVDRVLTSGRASSACHGREFIARLLDTSSGRIVVMPGAGISAENVSQLLMDTGVHEVHVGSGCYETIRQDIPQQCSVTLGTTAGGQHNSIRRVSADRVAKVLLAMRGSLPHTA